MGGTVKRIVKGTARLLLCILLIAVLLLSIVSGLLQFVLFNRELYARRIADDAYGERIIQFLDEEIDYDCYVYQLPVSVVKQVLSDESVKQHCRTYILALYDALLSGEGDAAVSYPQDGLYAAIEAYLQTQEGALPEQVAEDAAYLSEALASRVDETVMALAGQTFLQPLSRYLYAADWAHRLADLFWPACLMAVVCTVLMLLWGAERMPQRLYRTAGVWFGSAAAVFVPAALIRLYDLPGRIVLAESPLKLLFAQLWNTLVGTLFGVSLCILLVAFALLIGAIVWIVRRREPAEP